MTSVTLDPAVLAWAGRLEEVSARIPNLRSPDIAQRRVAEHELSDLIAVEVTADSPDALPMQDLQVPTPAGPIAARCYRPLGDGPFATQLFLHGGGFVAGSAKEVVNDRMLRSRSEATGVQFVSLDYRLAPENPYPAAVEDVLAALDWLDEHGEQIGADKTRLGIGGISAGGGIVASALLRRRDEGRSMPVHQLLEVPAVSLSPVGSSAVDYATGFGLEGLEMLRDLYVGSSPVDAYASPLDLADLSGMPRTLILTAEFDPLRDGAEAYADRLQHAGCDALAVRGEGHVHASLTLTATYAAAVDWQQTVIDELLVHLVNAEGN